MGCLCSVLSVQSVRLLPSSPAPGPILQDPLPNRRVSDVCAVCAVYAFSTGAGSNFAGYKANRRVSAVNAVCVFYVFGAGAGSDFSGSSSAAYAQVDGNCVADRRAKLRHMHLAI